MRPGSRLENKVFWVVKVRCGLASMYLKGQHGRRGLGEGVLGAAECMAGNFTSGVGADLTRPKTDPMGGMYGRRIRGEEVVQERDGSYRDRQRTKGPVSQ
jgi:hypothetical protein